MHYLDVRPEHPWFFSMMGSYQSPKLGSPQPKERLSVLFCSLHCVQTASGLNRRRNVNPCTRQKQRSEDNKVLRDRPREALTGVPVTYALACYSIVLQVRFFNQSPVRAPDENPFCCVGCREVSLVQTNSASFLGGILLDSVFLK